MSNLYHINTKSKDGFCGSNGLKTTHAVISHMFEQCLLSWKKGQGYPDFKICGVSNATMLITTPAALLEKEFSIVYNNENSTTRVVIRRIDEGEIYNFSLNDKVVAYGTLSMYKNIVMNGKRSKRSFVRSEYSKLILDKEEFYKTIEQRTGISPTEISVEPLYVDKDAVPGNKTINSAFNISIIGHVNDASKTNTLAYRSIGQDIGYGFGALHVGKLE